ncbi:MAG TPA: phosphatidylglycerol lysyltransferase domain-containing protein, partial [Myxococcaceae bacterium]|nr:phosphatidylglycerol lysyltransferase domain-containing protein [Myxococcaceae bacterium]
SSTEVEQARPLCESATDTVAYLALLADKQLLFNDKKSAFIMYAAEGRSWVSLRDPIGSEEDSEELIWRFRELSDRHGGWTVFYQVDAAKLHLYLELGLSFFKLGEEARVRLDGFSLDGSSRKGLRYVQRKLEKEGYSFSVLAPEEVARAMPELKAISDAWLKEKNTREKGFSLGYFDEGYLKHFPHAVVRNKEGKLAAFANLWPGGGKEELSIDLMRYLPDFSNGVMDYLFTHLMLWGKQQGYRWFNLGMAPLSGLEDRQLAPLWNRVGARLFRLGENFYNFQGLRQYKEKFDPQWQPKYLACPGGIALPTILTNVVSLVSRGLRGAISK